MHATINILLGLQLGMQLIAAYFVLRIAILKITPSIYYIITVNLLLMSFVRLDYIFNIIHNMVFKFGIWTIISFLWMYCFAQIYYLIKKK